VVERDSGLLTIFVNLENVDGRLTEKITKEMESEFFPNDNNRTNYFKLVYFEPALGGNDNNHQESNKESLRRIELDENGEQISIVKQKVKDILIKLSIDNYVVTVDPNSDLELVISKRTEVKTAGELHCRHCGMEFEDMIQLGNHLRIHYMI
jgi:hypothetical protein